MENNTPSPLHSMSKETVLNLGFTSGLFLNWQLVNSLYPSLCVISPLTHVEPLINRSIKKRSIGRMSSSYVTMPSALRAFNAL